MKCSYCGHENHRKAKRCSRCGKSLRVAKEIRNIYRLGTVLVILILIGGGAALFIASRGLTGSIFGSGSQVLEAAAQHTDPTDTGVEDSHMNENTPGTIGGEDDPTKDDEEETQEETVEELPLTGELTDDTSIIDLSGYEKVTVASADASTVLPSKNGQNVYAGPSAFDGDESTCWQEGESGDGTGATLTAHLDREYTIRFIILKLGHWRSDDSYRQNGRPQTLTVQIGEESFQISCPDEKKEHCITLSKDVTADTVTFRLDGVYPGEKYNDTCIADIEIDGY